MDYFLGRIPSPSNFADEVKFVVELLEVPITSYKDVEEDRIISSEFGKTAFQLITKVHSVLNIPLPIPIRRAKKKVNYLSKVAPNSKFRSEIRGKKLKSHEFVRHK